MENMVRIKSLHICTTADAEKTADMIQQMEATDAPMLIISPAPDDPASYLGVMLTKYHTPILSAYFQVKETETQGRFTVLRIASSGLRGFVHRTLHAIQTNDSPQPKKVVSEEFLSNDFFATATQDFGSLLDDEFASEPPKKPLSPEEQFLQEHTPAQIEEELNKRIIGQPQLTKAVADFLYYHALRQLHPELPPRPLMISGPSGSGKTEVWRVAEKLYGNIFPVKIIDGSSLTCDGWAGGNKISTHITPTIADGGIVVVDEFDKLTVPRISSSGSNVSKEMQSEFLKLIEGEYHITQNRKDTGLTSQKMGFVMVGAFEALRGKAAPKAPAAVAPIGFCPQPKAVAPAPVKEELADEDFIAYGIMPEIVGRIAAKCCTAPLSQEACLRIIRGPYSRVAVLAGVLKEYGIEEDTLVTDEEILDLLNTSRSNQTGFRWVSAQVENRMLERIRQGGLPIDKAS